MKLIENFMVLNIWVLFVDFFNEYWFIVMVIIMEIFICVFMVQCFCNMVNESVGYKENF